MKRLDHKLQRVPVPTLALWRLVIVVIVQAIANYYLGVQVRGVRAELDAIYQQNVRQYLLDQQKQQQNDDRLHRQAPEKSY